VDVGTRNSQVVDEATVNSFKGAVGLYNGAIGRMENAVGQYALTTSLFTDELNETRTLGDMWQALDARTKVDSSILSDYNFRNLSGVRGQAQQAIGALARYPTLASPAMTGELYALQGMSEVLLAELFCSGIPLTDAPLGQDFTYSGALSMTDVLHRAVAHFDSALAMANDSVAIVTLAKVGKGRALLDLGEYDSAAAAVAGVATGDQYLVRYITTSSTAGLRNPYAVDAVSQAFVVTSAEGQNGMIWKTTPQDPRVPLAALGSQWKQAKYLAASSPIVFADGVEARLIEAEARLHAKDYGGWITILQTLAASLPGTPTPTDPGAVGGSDSARVSLQFHERAFWLFMTGHRQGDLRRLIRQYGRAQVSTYPTGTYTPSLFAYPVYGSDINVAPPRTERDRNPLYAGCLDRNA
jgi:hypothetical protein